MSTARKEPATAASPDRATILRSLREAYAGPAWHGPSVRVALRGISAEQAAARPAPGRNTIWELVLHLAYARHGLLLRVATAPRGGGAVVPAQAANVVVPRDSRRS